MRVIVTAVILGSLGFAGWRKISGARNQLAAEQAAIHTQFSDLNEALQNRADLVSGLIGAEQGFASAEKQLFDETAEARNALLRATTPRDKRAANAKLDTMLERLLALEKRYPNLKKSQDFRDLRDDVIGSRNLIDESRLRYNKTLQDYNIDLELFPNNVAAAIFGFHQEQDAYF